MTILIFLFIYSILHIYRYIVDIVIDDTVFYHCYWYIILSFIHLLIFRWWYIVDIVVVIPLLIGLSRVILLFLLIHSLLFISSFVIPILIDDDTFGEISTFSFRYTLLFSLFIHSVFIRSFILFLLLYIVVTVFIHLSFDPSFHYIHLFICPVVDTFIWFHSPLLTHSPLSFLLTVVLMLPLRSFHSPFIYRSSMMEIDLIHSLFILFDYHYLLTVTTIRHLSDLIHSLWSSPFISHLIHYWFDTCWWHSTMLSFVVIYLIWNSFSILLFIHLTIPFDVDLSFITFWPFLHSFDIHCSFCYSFLMPLSHSFIHSLSFIVVDPVDTFVFDIQCWYHRY